MKDLQSQLCGKTLLASELTDLSPDALQAALEQKIIQQTAGLAKMNGRLTCQRCGNRDSNRFASHHCARCGKECAYCRNCIMMGKVASCSTLIHWTGPPVVFPFHEQCLQWQGTLSPGQQAAADLVVRAVQQKQTALVWAVCGAGKTEVLFPGIAAALSQGERVCIATPRTDVVLELAPRLKQAFPSVTIASLYGGSEEKNVLAQLVVSTTHQLLRYQEAFDLVVIDEVDAFPYSMDQALQYAAARSRKPISSLIYLTATPSRELQKQAAANTIHCATIPARFHRHPIPVPRYQWCGNWKKAFSLQNIPVPIQEWYREKLASQTPFLLFFPHIEIMNACLPFFQQDYPELMSVHSEDPKRKEKVQALREGKVLGLMTTTILERGVTIPRLHAAVVGAEEGIFTESALVQIAGRVGRKADYPTGDIVFFHYGKTWAMKRAVRQIETMNKEAAERGMIDV
ncbi:DEAD/DEAH box helicase [Bacillus testis]|uniref:DEAD/DEAH box helicase n=1 Tax=Bacillus testis TaxID=1622072 RepID=UPI00067EF6C8|nr:DEAD/DEAH box helicase [Bacillus testis]